MLNNNFSYTQLAFDYVPQKDSHYVNEDSEAYFLFLLQKDFHVLLFEAFPCVFNNSYLPFLCTEKKFIQKSFYLVFLLSFLALKINFKI